MTTMNPHASGQREARIGISTRATAPIVGVLFLSATASFIAGEQLIARVLRSADALASSGNILGLGALLAFVDGLAVVGIAVLLLPVLRHVSEPLAFGYVGLRVTEFAAILLYVASPLYISALVGAVTDGTVGTSAVQGLRPALVAAHDMALQLIYLLNGIAGSLLAVLLYRSRLIPRAIAGLGLIGYPVLLVGTILAIFRMTDVTQGAGLLAVVPGALFELVLPIWLITRGFAGSDVADEPLKSWSGPAPQLQMT
jgi:Domain of unknown function (DUF4386)